MTDRNVYFPLVCDAAALALGVVRLTSLFSNIRRSAGVRSLPYSFYRHSLWILVEIETMLPSTTPLLLTTDSKHFSASNTDLRVSITSNERYFDRPDVLEGFRRRLIIQTPSYKEGVPDVGRFRPRDAEDVNV